MEKNRVLHRGTGCHTCRHRKVKCDGMRPACGRCVKSRAECSYDEEIKKSKITLLRDEIVMLRSRVHELETEATIRSDIIRPHPYTTYPPAVSPTISDNSLGGKLRDGSPTSKPFVNGDVYSQQIVPVGGPAHHPIPPGTATGFQAPLPYGNTSSGWREVAPSASTFAMATPPDQPLTTAETLYCLHIILPFRLQCAFEIDVPTFEASLDDPDPNNRPHDALLNAIALMACYYDQNLRGANRAQVFVERTRHSLQNSLTGYRSRKVVQQIQAGHLLSCYLYWTGSLLEGHAALANAVSLARLCNLHKITSLDWNARGDNLLEEPNPYRPQQRPMPSILSNNPSRNAIEHGERIHCFWNLLLMDTGGSVATGYPLQFTASDSDPGTKIETMYPLALGEYASIQVRAHTPHTSYSDIFYPETIYSPDDTPLIFRIKAALLLHRVARLGTINKSGESEQEFGDHWINLRSCLGAFIEHLQPLPVFPTARPPGTDITDERRAFMYLFVAQSLALCAQVVMYSITPPAWRNQQLQEEALRAAKGIVGLIERTRPSEDELKMMDVMVGYSWMTASNFLINLRNAHERDPRQVHVSFDPTRAEQQLDRLEWAANTLAKTCRPVVRQAQGTREFRARKAGPYEATPVQAPSTWNS